MPEADAACTTAADDPSASRRAALERLARLLRRQGLTVHTAHWHLTATRDGSPTVEVWCHTRADDGGRLWFTHAGGTPISPATHPAITAAAVHRIVKRPHPN
ncbi:hypothetical protein LO762_30290 [Actinocorallia sp. API 0066]|uniref:hypothetical protein n=1 Tax=Actinocorallia sp. API 0066 TaxID=2896846 RepID=UPI001E325E80|nr:hypothetical protein [Actinocorallia sp. API 0066]MCD0453440.1 hypothetical protein [Actinocorallia sp. API 0066]